MARARAKRIRLERWQALLAAAVTAVASVVVALLGLGDDTGPSPRPSASSSGSPSPGPSLSGSGPPTVVAIISWSERPLPPPPGKRYEFTGIARNLPAGQSFIYVIAAEGSRAPGRWLASPPFVPTEDGRWAIQWDLPDPPAQARWMAVVWFESCPAGGCAGIPLPQLEKFGPDAPGVVAVATPSPTPRR
jgi:hypothetical protein